MQLQTRGNLKQDPPRFTAELQLVRRALLESCGGKCRQMDSKEFHRTGALRAPEAGPLYRSALITSQALLVIPLV